jgi:hypothetical protein
VPTPNVNPNAQATGFQFNGKDALIGGLFGSFFNSPILGALVGSVARSLFAPNAQDMNAAYDPARATQGGSTFNFGDLKGMFDGLMGNLRDILDGQAQRAQAQGEFRNQAAPETHEDSVRTGRPAQGPSVEQQAQTQSTGTSWGKILKWGAIGLAGLTLVNNLPFLGFMGMPFYGAAMGYPYGRVGW